MASKTATRLWRVHEKAGRPWPVFDDDDVIDYMIMEAVVVKAGKEEEEIQHDKDVQDWKTDESGLDEIRQAIS